MQSNQPSLDLSEPQVVSFLIISGKKPLQVKIPYRGNKMKRVRVLTPEPGPSRGQDTVNGHNDEPIEEDPTIDRYRFKLFNLKYEENQTQGFYVEALIKMPRGRREPRLCLVGYNTIIMLKDLTEETAEDQPCAVFVEEIFLSDIACNCRRIGTEIPIPAGIQRGYRSFIKEVGKQALRGQPQEGVIDYIFANYFCPKMRQLVIEEDLRPEPSSTEETDTDDGAKRAKR